MADDVTPSVVFPMPGYNGPINLHHGQVPGGSDIMAPVGTKVVSMVSGKVVFTSTQANAPDSGGNAVQIHGNDGLDYYYAHFLNPVNLVKGDTVVAGQQLGAVDNTGNAKYTPPHLHIGIGYGINEGKGPSGGVGKSYDAVSRLIALVKDPRANDASLVDPNVKPNPPTIQFVPSVPGFTSDKADIIKLIVEKAIAAGVDPFIALAIASKESTLNPNAKNPSGACGLMQLLPCIPNGFDPATNIDEGLKRLKDKLSACNGNITCALNNYSGGGGPAYVGDVVDRAKAIQTANPSLSTGGFSIPIVGGVYGTPGIGNVTSGPPTEKCPPIELKIGPSTVPFPDFPCLIRETILGMIGKLTDWWKSWQTEHIPNWTFVILGLILIIIGGMALAQAAGIEPPQMKAASTVAKAASATKAAQ